MDKEGIAFAFMAGTVIAACLAMMITAVVVALHG